MTKDGDEPEPKREGVNARPGRAHRVGTDPEHRDDGIDREPTRSRTRSEWEAADDRSPPRGESPFPRDVDDENEE